MKLNEIMTRDVEIIHPDDSLQTAARKMRDRDIGFLPVCDGDRLVGVLSDRDISVRAMAQGVDGSAVLSENLLTSPAIYCFEDQDVEEAAQLMRENEIRRLVVLDHDKRVVGIVSSRDLSETVTHDLSGEGLQSVSGLGTSNIIFCLFGPRITTK